MIRTSNRIDHLILLGAISEDRGTLVDVLASLGLPLFDIRNRIGVLEPALREITDIQALGELSEGDPGLPRSSSTPGCIVYTLATRQWVAAIQREHGFSGERAALVILRNAITVERASRAYARTFIEISNFLADPGGGLSHIREQLSLGKSNEIRHLREMDPETNVPGKRSAKDHPDCGRFSDLLDEVDVLHRRAISQPGDEITTGFDNLADTLQSLVAHLDPLVLELLESQPAFARAQTDHLREVAALTTCLREELRSLRIASNRERNRTHRLLQRSLERQDENSHHFEWLQNHTSWLTHLDSLVAEQRVRTGSGFEDLDSTGAPGPEQETPVEDDNSGESECEEVQGNHVISTADRIASITFPGVGTPAVSIIIPVYGSLELTVLCLESITALTDTTSYEVILIDDASPMEDTSALQSIPGLRYERNDQNLGFIGTCNRGAGIARGDWLLFLNSDTQIQPGSLDRMCHTFDTFSDAGIVGGKLIYPDGSLQEAGGIVWRDGSAWNDGHGMNPDAPEFNYCRAVDYCSGALLMIPRRLFNQLGGFDTIYTPAYYEDTDLAFRVRELGKCVYYQPKASAIHFEGASCGTNLETGHKQYQLINAKKFYERWKECLLSHRPNGEHPNLERERKIKRRILILDYKVPTPDQDSGSLRMYNMIRVLHGLGFKATLFAECISPSEPYTSNLQSMGVEIIAGSFADSLENFLRKRGPSFDTVIVSRVEVAQKHLDTIELFCPNARVIFDTVDLHFLREQRGAEISGDPAALANARETRAVELTVARRCDCTFLVSLFEKELLAETAPDLRTYIVSNIHEIHPPRTPFVERRDILFIGGFNHAPNSDGLLWFCREIFPLVRAENPTIRLHVVGAHVSDEIQALASDDIIVNGYEPNVSSLLDSCRLTVAPLRYGAGVKGKVNQSLAHGVPCVATPIAAEGALLEDEWDIIIRSDEEAFAAAILEIYVDEERWNRLSRNGLENIERSFSFDAARRSLSAALCVNDDSIPLSETVRDHR